MSSQRIRTTVFLAAGLALGACASTSIVDSWKAPEAGPLRFKKVVALAILDNESLRSRAEDALQSSLRGVQAVQGYKVFGATELADLERQKKQLTERLLQDGFDGVVALRMVSSQQEVGWTGSQVPLDAFVWYPTGEMAVDTIIRVEIQIYSLTEGKLMWAGVSETFNPKDAEQLVSEIAAAAGKELRRQGLIST